MQDADLERGRTPQRTARVGLFLFSPGHARRYKIRGASAGACPGLAVLPDRPQGASVMANAARSGNRPAQVTFWGAAHTVTGSMHLVEAAGQRLLLDCGLY